MKKIISLVLALVLVFTIGIQAFCAEPTNNNVGTTLSTEIPYNHNIKITYNEGGYVLLGGRICPSGTVVTVDRFGGIDLQIICKKDYTVKEILVNGENQTSNFINGTLKLRNVINDVDVVFEFTNTSSTDIDDAKNIPLDMEGCVFLGKHKLQNAQLTVDFGDFKASTDSDGRYVLQNIPTGRHIVSVSKDGKNMANFQIFVERADVTDTKVEILPDGTKKITAPLNAEKVYVDFIIKDDNGDGFPDVNPDDTNPMLPPDTNPSGTGDPDNNYKDDGVSAQVGEQKKDPILPNLGAVLMKYPFIAPTVMAVSLFFIVLLLIIKKKRNDEEEEPTA